MMLLGGWGRWPGTHSPFGCHQGHASMTRSFGSTPSPAADTDPSQAPDVFQEVAGAGGGCGLLLADSASVWPLA